MCPQIETDHAKENLFLYPTAYAGRPDRIYLPGFTRGRGLRLVRANLALN